MKTLNLVQGSPEWAAHRAQHRNASDAPAMLSCSPYKSRTQLLHELKTGLAPEVDGATQRRFDDGHRFEALARPVAARIVGEDLYPVVGSEGKYSASFDGLTMAEDVAFEHKSLNDELRAALISDAGTAALPKHYRVQMEQQLMVSGAARVLFMASKWAGDDLVEEMHDWYEPDQALRAEIIAGWEQFEVDLAAYTPPASTPVVVASPVQALPAVSVQVTGEIAVRENFAAFETAVRDFLEHRLIRSPKTDQDFADLDVQIKAMKGAEAALEAAESQMLAQIQTVDSAKKTKDMLAKLVRDNRLMAEKLLTTEKERRRGEIVVGGNAQLAKHIAGLNTRLGNSYMPAVPADFAGVIKGKKTLTSMEDAVASELARSKIAANAAADRIDANLKHLAAEAGDYEALFPDVAVIVQKQPDDFEALVQFRVADHKAKEQRRADALAEQARERIRQEEAARLQREQQEAAQAAAATQAQAAVQQAAATPPPAARPSAPAPISAAANTAKPVETAPSLTLGQISARLGFSLTGDFLRTLGFEPTKVKASLMFHESEFDAICSALIEHVESVRETQPA